MKIIYTGNLSPFSILCLDLETRFNKINKPLPWIEPSINMIHLDVVRSYVFRSSMASIGCTTYLLEHSLRMALWDPINSGSLRVKPTNQLFNATLGKLLSEPQYKTNLNLVIPHQDDLLWWNKVTKAIRNKVNHVDIPAIFQIAKELNFVDDYAYNGLDTYNIEEPDSWGMFWHRYGDKLAEDFICQATDQIIKVINCTKWTPDVSWWISQKYEYENFFGEKWDFESLQKSLNKVYSPNN